MLTPDRLYLLVLDLLHLICYLLDDEVLGAGQLDGLDQCVQATGVLSQNVQQVARPLGIRATTADLLLVVTGNNPA